MVTVGQYQGFVEVPDGYADDRWWTPAGRAWRGARVRPDFFGDRDAEYASQAMNSLTWYEASAYCAWLTAQLHTAGALAPGETVRLPTEAEWEVAASYDARGVRHVYPWGDTPAPTLAHAIFNEAQLDRVPPVGCCPAGVAACGAHDMTGTVWEWYASRHGAYPAAADAVYHLFNDNDRDAPLRGEAFYGSSTDVGCGARVGYPPLYGDPNNGFRLVVSRARTDSSV